MFRLLIRAFSWNYGLPLLLLLLLLTVGVALLYRTYHHLRGRRDRDRGLPCQQRGKTAFPMEGTTMRYRCWNCGCRFAGAEHW
jgi:hypothetical protein